MAERALSQTFYVQAWNTTNNAPQLTDAANISLKVSKDGGTSTATTNSPADIDQGVVKITLTAAECTADTLLITGSSTTGNVVVIPVMVDTRSTADVDKVSGDSTAATNLEADYDGTGYSKGNSTINTATNVTNTVSADMVSISGDTPAADNLEADYDGTGFSRALSTIGTATNVTNQVTADVVAISGDTAAANNLEAMYDGTGYTDESGPASRSQVNNLTSATGSISTTAASVTVTTGTPTGTYTNTHTLDGVYHQITPAAGNTEVYYQFNIAGDGVPVDVIWDGYAQSNADSYSVFAYNWAGTAWQQIGSIEASNGTTNIEKAFSLTTAHVGTGANLGKVRCRFLSTTGTNLYTDRILCSYAVVNRSVGYSNGAIWIDTTNGLAGTEPYVNGTADLPVDSLADALTLAASLNITRFEVAPGSTITLSATTSNKYFNGTDWSINLNNQEVNFCDIEGALVSGTATTASGRVTFAECAMGAVTLPGCTIRNSAFNSTLTMSAGDYYFIHCTSAVAGATSPIFDVGVGGLSTNLSFRGWSGGIDLRNFGQAGTDTMTLEGWGKLTINANCVGGTIDIRGTIGLVNNGSGITINDEPRMSRSAVVDDIWDETTASHVVAGTFGGELSQYDAAGDTVNANVTQINSNNAAAVRLALSAGQIIPGTVDTTAFTPTATQFECDDISELTNDHYNGRIVIWTTGPLAGQATDITDYTYSLGRGLFTVTAMTDVPQNDDTFVIV